MKRAGVLICIWLAAVAPLARAIDIPGLYGTGVDNAGNPLAPGTVDPHYTLETSFGAYGPAAFVASAMPEAWNTTPGDSQWIAPAWYADADFADPAGNWYVYTTTFDLTGYDHRTAVIRLVALADDGGEVYLNGQPAGIPTLELGDSMMGFGFEIDSGFVSGINTLEFRIQNRPMDGPNPTGLRVSVEGTVAEEGLGIAYEAHMPFGMASEAAIDLIYSGTVTVTARDAFVVGFSDRCDSSQIRDTLTLTADDPLFCIHGRIIGSTTLMAVHEDGRELEVPVRIEPTVLRNTGAVSFLPGQPDAVVEFELVHGNHQDGFRHFVSPLVEGRGVELDIIVEGAGIAEISREGSKRFGDRVKYDLGTGESSKLTLGFDPLTEGYVDLWVEAYARLWGVYERTRIYVEDVDLPYRQLYALVEAANVSRDIETGANGWITTSLNHYFNGEIPESLDAVDGFSGFVLNRTGVKRGFGVDDAAAIEARLDQLRLGLSALR